MTKHKTSQLDSKNHNVVVYIIMYKKNVLNKIGLRLNVCME